MAKKNKKERHRAKREAKRRDTRRRDSVSPVKRLADAPGDLDCWMSDRFETFRQAQIFVYKRAAGLSGIACFLIDLGVVGLKDCWTDIVPSRAALDDILERCRSQGFAMRRATIDEVRNWIAGAARWAQNNGMRLPNDWLRCAAVLGGVGEWESADTSAFRMVFAGHPEDLRQRLVGQRFDDYIRRTDVAFTFSDAAPFKDQETGEYANNGFDPFDELDDDDVEDILSEFPEEELDALLQKFTPAATALARKTSESLIARNQTPSPALIEAWQALMLAAMLTNVANTSGDNGEDPQVGIDAIEAFGERFAADAGEDYGIAIQQAMEHLTTNTQIMREAMLDIGGGSKPQ